MAKYDEREGNSCHIHLSLRAAATATAVFADASDPHGMSATFRSFLAGQLATLRELTLFYAPNINSYKRFADGSFAPTAVAWGLDNRTCALRVVGHGTQHPGRMPRARRRRQPVPRGRGADRRRAVRYRAGTGAARAVSAATRTRPPTCERLPDHAGRGRRAVRRRRALAREAFGDDVVAHYLNNARVELAAFNAAVTDWERIRGFERL